MAMALGVLSLLLGSAGQAAVPQTVRSSICALRMPVVAGDAFSVITFPAPKRNNESGVLFLVNCSAQRIISLRDPSRSRRHVNEFVYDPGIRARLPADSYRYEVINFNKRANNTPFEHTSYADRTYWDGPCVYENLELTTASANNARDRRTITFTLNICENQILALILPTGAAPSDKH